MSRVCECLLFLKYQGTFWFRQFSLIEQRSVYELYNCVAIQEYVPSDSLRFVDFSNFILLINSICDEVSFFLASHFLLRLSLSHFVFEFRIFEPTVVKTSYLIRSVVKSSTPYIPDDTFK